jgi:hypothetical protein
LEGDSEEDSVTHSVAVGT